MELPYALLRRSWSLCFAKDKLVSFLFFFRTCVHRWFHTQSVHSLLLYFYDYLVNPLKVWSKYCWRVRWCSWLKSRVKLKWGTVVRHERGQVLSLLPVILCSRLFSHSMTWKFAPNVFFLPSSFVLHCIIGMYINSHRIIQVHP